MANWSKENHMRLAAYDYLQKAADLNNIDLKLVKNTSA
jgi:hypothetical protein